jgi:hypothetical protein
MKKIKLNTRQHIEHHEKCISLLEDIQHFHNLIAISNDALSGISGTIPELRNRYEHDRTIYEMCIVRLFSRYVKIINEVGDGVR